jgi:hypothetical protein
MAIPFISIGQSGSVNDLFTGEPVQYATIILKGTKEGARTDENGKFSFPSSCNQHCAGFTISAVGYEAKTIPPSRIRNSGQTIYLKPAVHELKPVVVIGYPAIRCGPKKEAMVKGSKEVANTLPTQCISGKLRCLARGVDVTTEMKMERAVKVPQNISVKVYPNPIIAGSNIQASVQLKVADQFHIDLVDAGGRVIWMKKLNITSTQFNLAIPSQSTLSAGVYWLRIIGSQSQKIYSGKIVVQ